MDNLEAKKHFTKIGKVIFVFAIAANVFTYIFLILKDILLSESLANNDILDLIVSFAPMYLLALPLALFMFKKIPSKIDEPQKITFKKFVTYFIECIAVMYIGNLIGTLLSSLLSNGQATNPVEELTSNNNLFQILIIAVIGPIIEEFLFRKQMIDHTVQYGEKTAIVFSALTFGLFHMNFYQFFYAFGLGLIFGYIYVKTHNIKYTMIMHIIINFFGGVVAPYILSKVDPNVLLNASQNIEQFSEAELMSMLAPALVFCVYALILVVLVIIGVVLLIKNIKKISFNRFDSDIPKGEVFKTVYINVYYVLFTIFCISMMVYVLLK